MEKILKVFNARQMVGKFAKCAMLAACFGMIMGMSGVANAAPEVRNARGVLLGYLTISDNFNPTDTALELADNITVGGTITGGSFAVVDENKITNFTVSSEGNTAISGTLGVTGMATFNGGIDAKGNKIVNVAAGDITSATSTDAVNGGQLFTMTNVESAGNYIAVGTGVAGNLAALDTQVKANADALEGKADKADVENAIKQGNESTLKAAKEYTDEQIKGVTIAVGDRDKNNAKVGYGNGVEGKNSTALGTDNKVTGTNSTAVGSKNIVNGNSSGAFGDPTVINGDNSYAVGNENQINVAADAKGSFILGNGNTVNTDDTFVLGNNVKTTAKGSVILGSGSEAKEENVVSVGKAGNERKIVNVAEGENPTDAVNKKQLDEVNAKTMGQISATNDRVNRVGATAAALAAINYQPMSKGQSQVAVGMGSYKGKKATALGVAYQISDRVSGAVAGAANGSEHMVNVGFNYLFGQHSNKDVAQMAATSGSMSLKEAELQAEVDSLKNEIAELKAMVKALAASK